MLSRMRKIIYLLFALLLAASAVAVGAGVTAAIASNEAGAGADVATPTLDENATDVPAHSAASPVPLSLRPGCADPDDPDELPERTEVTETDDYPYSAVGAVQTQSGSGSGVLVSPRHVATAAHVVTDDEGNKIEDVQFAPGYRNSAGEPTEYPYGSHDVEKIRRHPDFDVGYVAGDTGAAHLDDFPNDLALLTLDQPVGDAAGTMEFGFDSEMNYLGSYSQAGYPCGFDGDPMVGTPTVDGVVLENAANWIVSTNIAGVPTEELLEYQLHWWEPGTTHPGDSGSPVWHTVGGEPKVVSISVGRIEWNGLTTPTAGAIFNSEREAMFREWIEEDRELEPKPELYVTGSLANGPVYAPSGGEASPQVVESRDEPVEVSTTVYNDGPAAAQNVTVEFIASRAQFEYAEMCSTTVSLSGYSGSEVSCESEMPRFDTFSSTTDVHAVIDPDDEVEEYEDVHDDRSDPPHAVTQIQTEYAPELVIDDVETRTHVAPSSDFTVDVVVQNDGSEPASGTVAAFFEDGQCDPVEVDSLSPWSSGENAQLSCRISEDVTPGEELDLVVSTGDDEYETTVEVIEIDYTNDAQFEVTDMELDGMPDRDIPYIEIGDEFTVVATVTNVGSEAGTREFRVDAGGTSNLICSNQPNGDSNLDFQRSLAPGESAVVELHCDIHPSSSPSDSSPYVSVQYEHGSGDRVVVEEFYDWDEEQYPNGWELIEPDGWPEIEILQYDLVGQPEVGENTTTWLQVRNAYAVGNATIRLHVDGEQVDAREYHLNRYEYQGVPLEHAPAAGEWGEQTWTVDTGAESESITTEVQPAPFDVALLDADDEVAPGDEVQFDVQVRNLGEGRDVQPVELTFGDEVVDTTTVDLGAGNATTVTLSGTAPEGRSEPIRASVEGLTDNASSSVVTTTPPLDVSIEDVRDPITHATEEVDVTIEVSNPASYEQTASVAVLGGPENVTTANVTVAAGGSKSVTVSADVDPAGNDTQTITVATSGATDDRTVDVAEPLDLTLEGQYEPGPSGSDGLYRDVTGDGRVTQTDVIALLEHQHRSVIQDRPEYFDYSGNGAVNQFDVVELFEYSLLH